MTRAWNWVRGAMIALGLMLAAGAASAQSYWVQIEARPTLAQAQDRAVQYGAILDDVGGFYLGGDYYGIVLGPFTRDEAVAVRDRLAAAGRIAGDSFVRDGRGFLGQFYPTDRNLREQRPRAAITATPLPEPEPEPTPVPAPAPAPEPLVTAEIQPEAEAPLPPIDLGETLEDARAAEDAMSEDDRTRLQLALEYAGFYEAGIDGDFGPATRAAMRAWQTAEGAEATGVLTTTQRETLMGEYDSLLNGLGLQITRNEAAGIEIVLPLGVVAEAATTPPFVRYEPTGETPAQVLLISETGDAQTLAALYQIFQSLEIVPPQGSRALTGGQFTIEGRSETLLSYTFAGVFDGAVKGFTLSWPANDEARWQRVVSEMLDSFTPIAGVLGPAPALAAADDPVDMTAGLALLTPRAEATGFFVTPEGAVVTAAEAVRGCGSLRLDGGVRARVLAQDAVRGLALLAPEDAVSPKASARFGMPPAEVSAPLAVAGFPYGGAVAAPVLTFGQLAAAPGADRLTLDLAAGPGDAGGPILTQAGAVAGVLLPVADGAASQGPRAAVPAQEVVAFLTALGVAVDPADPGAAPLSANALSARAAEMTVLVSCY